MKQMQIRKVHRTIGICLAPFFIVTALCGLLLLFRNAGIFDPSLREFLRPLHNWEIIYFYVGSVVALGLTGMAISGVILFLMIRKAMKKKSQ